jgi:vacuolar-type H+-ATPase subunit H
MPEEHDDNKEPLVLLQSFPLDEHTAEEEKIESMWRQMMVYKAFADHDLSESRARRAEAEAVRERTEREALANTQALCVKLRDDAESERMEARREYENAAETNRKANEAFAKAKEAVAQAERDRDKMIASAEKQAQEIIDTARAAAQQETTELRRQALKEVKSVLSRVETMRAAANEELETQRILSNVAKLKATSRWMMSGEQQDENGNAVSAEPEFAAAKTAQPSSASPVIAQQPVAQPKSDTTRESKGASK